MNETCYSYVFGNNSMYKPEFAWAGSILPRSPMVDYICPECGFTDRSPSGAFDVIIDEDGELYPDVLGCGAYPFLIVSEKVIQVWNEARICCFHTFPVEVAEVRSEKLQSVPAPHYFRVEIDGRCRVDMDVRGVKILKICNTCHRIITKYTFEDSSKGFPVVPESWDGSDLFRDILTYPVINFCNQKILQLAKKYKLTNFRFECIEGPLDSNSEGIKYL